MVVVDMQGIRYSHPKPRLIGKHFIGDDLAPALQGNVNSAINRGTLAPALRVFVPVYDAQKQQIGVVALGIALDTVQRVVAESRWIIYWTIAFAALVGSTGTFFGLRTQAHHVGFRALRNLQPVRTAQRHAAID